MQRTALYGPAVRRLAAEALGELIDDTARVAPDLAGILTRWITRRPSSSDPRETSIHPDTGYPMLLLPWWAEGTVSGAHTPAFQRALMGSTLAGYSHARLLEATPEAGGGLLPATALLLSRFYRPYREWFPPESPLWMLADYAWTEHAEALVLDSATPPESVVAFVRFATRKWGPFRIPVAAALLRADRAECLPEWFRLCDALACAEQLRTDAFGDGGTGTSWFDREGARRGLTPVRWRAREGRAWSCALILHWYDAARDAAKALGALEASRFVARSQRAVEELRDAPLTARTAELVAGG